MQSSSYDSTNNGNVHTQASSASKTNKHTIQTN